MISSMTGYGRAEANYEGCSIVVEARSLNNRYLEIFIRQPRKFGSFEEDLEKIAKENLSRGKVNFNISFEGLYSSLEELSINMEVAEQYYKAFMQLGDKFNSEVTITPEHLLKFDDVFEWNFPEDKKEKLKKHVIKAFKECVKNLKKHKTEEGRNLAKDFKTRLKNIEAALKIIKKNVQNRHVEDYENLKKRILKLLNDIDRIDPDRMAMEAAFMAEKFDINEECVRLESHIKMFRDVLREGGIIGRKLDFLLQEMNREANTISSKSNSFDIAKEVVIIKEEVERIKEQIRNLE